MLLKTLTEIKFEKPLQRTPKELPPQKNARKNSVLYLLIFPGIYLLSLGSHFNRYKRRTKAIVKHLLKCSSCFRWELTKCFALNTFLLHILWKPCSSTVPTRVSYVCWINFDSPSQHLKISEAVWRETKCVNRTTIHTSLCE